MRCAHEVKGQTRKRMLQKNDGGSFRQCFPYCMARNVKVQSEKSVHVLRPKNSFAILFFPHRILGECTSSRGFRTTEFQCRECEHLGMKLSNASLNNRKELWDEDVGTRSSNVVLRHN